MKDLECLKNAQFQRDLPILEDYYKYCTAAWIVSTLMVGSISFLLYFL